MRTSALTPAPTNILRASEQQHSIQKSVPLDPAAAVCCLALSFSQDRTATSKMSVEPLGGYDYPMGCYGTGSNTDHVRTADSPSGFNGFSPPNSNLRSHDMLKGHNCSVWSGHLHCPCHAETACLMKPPPDISSEKNRSQQQFIETSRGCLGF